MTFERLTYSPSKKAIPCRAGVSFPRRLHMLSFSMQRCFSHGNHSWAQESRVVCTVRDPLANFAFCSHELCCTGSEISISEGQILAPGDRTAIASNWNLRWLVTQLLRTPHASESIGKGAIVLSRVTDLILDS